MISNSPSGFALDIDAGDVPLVADAISIQICTEIMGGRRKAADRLRRLQARLETAIPEAARPFDAGDWAIICAVVSAGGRPEIGIEAPEWKRWSREGAIVIIIGGARWRSTGFDYAEDAPVLDEIRTYLNSLAPLAD